MRTAIYTRVSTRGQKDTTSLPEQERLSREKVAQLGWEVSEPNVYKEVEGGEDLYRPCMDRLWEAIQRREVDAVVIDVLDRLSRDEGDQGAFYHHCDRYGVTVELASEDIDESEQGRNLRTLAGIVGRMERVDIRRRTQRGRKARVAKGKILAGAFPLYGYVWANPEKGKGQRTGYIPDPETWPIVVRIFEAVAAGVPVLRLCRELEAEGVLTPFQVLEARGQLPKGRTASPIWRRSTIRRMLHTPAYWGEHSAYRFSHTAVKIRPADTGVTRKVWQVNERDVDDPDRVALPDACPPLVSKELAERAHARLRQNKENSAGRNPDPLATLFRGMVVCGHCGGRMFTSARSGTSEGEGRLYKCSRRANGETCPGGVVSILSNALDPAGWADVRAWLKNEDNVRRLLAEWEQEARSAENSVTSRLEAVEATIKTLRGKMASLAETIAETANKESRRTLQEKLDSYGDQVMKEERKREKLMREAQDAVEHAREEREVREWVSVVSEHAATFTRLEQVAALRFLGAQVTVWRADHVHEDGWPQRYKIVLHWTGFTGEPVMLPARKTVNPDSNNV
jgi:DNA invertase Pin-like site-specific DNA recombinase